MGIYIKEINMPKDCYSCPCHNGENGHCNILKVSIYDYIPKDCPLIEVPTPHGRLIDAYELTKDLSMKRCIGRDWDGNLMYEITGRYTSIPVYKVDDAPTIIEAED